MVRLANMPFSQVTPERAPVRFCSRVLSNDPDGGGDLIDVRRGRSGAVGVTLGDVTGHGLEAAADRQRVRRVLAQLDESTRNRPCWFRRLNERLASELDVDRCCAAASAMFSHDGDAVRVSLAVAGIPRPIIVRADGEVEVPSSGAIPLGIDPDDSMLPTADEFTLHPGDKLLLFSDGLIECMDASGAMFGWERLRHVAAALAGASAEAVMSGLLSAARRHQGNGEMHDDIAIFVAEIEQAATVRTGLAA